MRIYKSINYEYLVTSFQVGKNTLHVTFENWHFQTDNKNLQEAIEADSGYEKEFKLLNDTSKSKKKYKKCETIKNITKTILKAETNDFIPKQKESINSKESSKNFRPKRAPIEDEFIFIEVAEVTNKQQAIEWFSTELDITMRSTISIDALKNKAVENGYNLVNLISFN